MGVSAHKDQMLGGIHFVITITLMVNLTANHVDTLNCQTVATMFHL